MTVIERPHGYTDEIVWTDRKSSEWSDADWDMLEPCGPGAIVGESRFESIRRRRGESSPRFIASLSQEIRSLSKTGKRVTRWRNKSTTSYRRTASGLVVAVRFEPAKRMHISRHLWASEDGEFTARPDGFHAVGVESMEPFMQVVGQVPSFEERFPMADQIGLDTMHGGVTEPWFVARHFLDAQNFAEVARSMYGARSYRKPLGRAIDGAHSLAHRALLPFRGLVPVDWIIDAYRAIDGHPVRCAPTSQEEFDAFRLTLRAFSLADRRRFLREIGERDEGALYAMRDISYENPAAIRDGMKGRDLGRARSLGEAHEKMSRVARAARRDGFRTETEKAVARKEKGRAVAQRMEREIRERGEYERLIGRTLTDAEWEASAEDRARRADEMAAIREADRRRRMTEEQRAAEQRARERERRAAEERRRRQEEYERLRADEIAWHREVAAKLHGLSRDGMRFEIAEESATLDRWSDEMNHCIDSYDHLVRTEVLGGIYRESDGKLMLNFAANMNEGVYQCLGNVNRPTGENTWAVLVEVFGSVGIEPKGRCWGSPKDGTPSGWSRDNRPVEIVEAPRVLVTAH